MGVQDLNNRFQYKRDSEQYGLQERWAILRNPEGPLVGDCEDYALTALWMLKGKDDAALHQSLKTGEAKIWFCYTPNGEAHAVLEFNGKLIDNIQKEWVSLSDLKAKGYEMSRPFTYKEVVLRLNAGNVGVMPGQLKENSNKKVFGLVGIAVAVGVIIWLVS